MEKTKPVRPTAAAEADFRNILLWTVKNFGEIQASAYAKTIADALAALTAGPDVLGAKARDDIVPGPFSLHVARKIRKGRHFVLFRIGHRKNREIVEVLRILHDSMDLAQHVPLPDEA